MIEGLVFIIQNAVGMSEEKGKGGGGKNWIIKGENRRKKNVKHKHLFFFIFEMRTLQYLLSNKEQGTVKSKNSR